MQKENFGEFIATMALIAPFALMVILGIIGG